MIPLHGHLISLTDPYYVQGFVIIRDEKAILSKVQDLAPMFLWDVQLFSLENEEKILEPVLVCRKKFWALV